jgi:CBS domain-containing protein
MIAQDFMTTTVVTCPETSTVGEAVKLMLDKKISVLPIVDSEDRLVGVLTESDFVGREKTVPHAFSNLRSLFGETFHMRDIEEVYLAAKGKRVSEVMSATPQHVGPEISLTEVVEFMSSKNLKRLPVVKEDKVVGIITRKDLIRAFDLLNK